MARIARFVLGVIVVLAPLPGATVVLMASAATAAPPPVLCTPAPSAACPSPPTQPGGLDHFLCYQSTYGSSLNSFPAPKLSLTNQFGTAPLTQPESNFPSGSDRLCNPVTKTLSAGQVYPPGNPNGHLLCMGRVAGPGASGTLVSVGNQFGTGDLTVGASTRLCVPSWKYDITNPSGPGSVAPTAWSGPSPPGLDHLVCYGVTYSDANSRHFDKPKVSLVDEFGPHQSVAVGDPVELCAPTTKTLAYNNPILTFPANNIDGGAATNLDSEHLLCFSVAVDSSTHSVQIGNQFSPGWIPNVSNPPAPVSATVLSADMLCLPSFKSVIPPPGTPEAPIVLLLPLSAVVAGASWYVLRRRHLALVDSDHLR